MGLVATFEATCEQLPLVEVAAAVPDAELSLEMRPNEDGHTLFVVVATGVDAADLGAAFAAASFVDEYTQVRAADGERRYHVLPAESVEDHYDDDFDVAGLTSLARTDCRIDETRVTPTGWVQSGWFADRETLDRFRSFWQDNGGFTLHRLARDGASEPPGEGLTDRQRAALVTAYEMGYFEIPRTASLESVAGALGISASSLSERLRRAQRHLLERTVVGRGRVMPGAEGDAADEGALEGPDD